MRKFGFSVHVFLLTFVLSIFLQSSLELAGLVLDGGGHIIIMIMIMIMVIIIIIGPGRLGLCGLSGGYSSHCSAQLGQCRILTFVTDRQTDSASQNQQIRSLFCHSQTHSSYYIYHHDHHHGRIWVGSAISCRQSPPWLPLKTNLTPLQC